MGNYELSIYSNTYNIDVFTSFLYDFIEDLSKKLIIFLNQR